MVTSTGQENIRAGTRFLGMGIEGWGCSVLRANVFNHPKVSTERAFLPGGAKCCRMRLKATFGYADPTVFATNRCTDIPAVWQRG